MILRQSVQFKKNEDQQNSKENTSTKGLEDTQITGGEKPEFDTIGTALNEL